MKRILYLFSSADSLYRSAQHQIKVVKKLTFDTEPVFTHRNDCCTIKIFNVGEHDVVEYHYRLASDIDCLKGIYFDHITVDGKVSIPYHKLALLKVDNL